MGWRRLEFLKMNVELLLVLETTWACPLLTQAIIEARVAVRAAEAASLSELLDTHTDFDKDD